MDVSQPYNGLLGLDKMPEGSKTVIWYLAFILAAGLSIFMFFLSMDPTVIPHIFGLNFIVAACLRLAGIRWRHVMTYLWAMPVFLVATYCTFLVYTLFNYTD